LTEDGNWYSTITIDGTYFSIYEPTHFSTEWFPHKFKGPGVRYELAISIRGGNIVHIHGPFPAKCPDIEIFRDCLMHKMRPGEFAEADKGYRGQMNCVRASDMYATSEESKIKGVS
jgi:hypothetical protein